MASKLIAFAWTGLLVLWLLCQIPPNAPPPSAAPSHYERSADYAPPPWPDTEDEVIEARFGGGFCPISRAAVTAQGVGE